MLAPLREPTRWCDQLGGGLFFGAGALAQLCGTDSPPILVAEDRLAVGRLAGCHANHWRPTAGKLRGRDTTHRTSAGRGTQGP